MEIVHVIMDLAIVVGLLLIISQMQKRHAAERSELMDRLMSRNFDEYKTLTATPVVSSEPVHVSEEEEYYREIEQMKSG
ncbi:hypothetical protein PV433_25950 [Paenibacillus sp. GYB004]|uniref:hypothetical protein n=1 Tax=Paenibacillus sp. GYB004 TaxID=2994393 RepID=UPI002F961771